MINRIVNDKGCLFSYTKHARERMVERGLIVSDVLFALKFGYVYEDSKEESTMPGYYKYRIESSTPNSGTRTLRIVAVPDNKSCQIKIITIMWRDEA
jgi:Domain of unknown function (DUF4258)